MTDVCQYKPSWKGVLMKNTFLFISVVICALVLVACSSSSYRTVKRSATLEGSQVVPPVNTNASGKVSVKITSPRPPSWCVGFFVPPECDICIVTIDGNVKNLSSEITVAHIHNSSRRVTLDLDISNDSVRKSAELSATFSCDNHPLTSLQWSSMWYIDVHTKNYPSGEVRGQLLRR